MKKSVRSFILAILFLSGLFSALSASASEPRFVEVDPDHSSEAFRDYIGAGLRALSRSDDPIALETLRSIESGRVKIDELADLTYDDFKRVLRDFRGYDSRLPLSPEDHRDLHRRGSRAARILRENLDGYQWADRIYIADGLSPKNLASTLVHETNHVLNQSHLHYYGSHEEAFTEEYRAFYVEGLFRHQATDDPAWCLRLKRRVQADYGFMDIDVADFPAHPRGRLIPSPAAWRAVSREL